MTRSGPPAGPAPRWRLLLPLAAVAFLFVLHWRGLLCWFYQDDFGWLHLGPATGIGHFLHILFAPKAHGNIRPWSENLFFYGLKSCFGVNPVPFRAVVFATMAANLLLAYGVAWRLTGSRLAAAGVQFCWAANPALAAVLCWTCVYNQVQYMCFLLLALWLLIHGRVRAQAAVFVLGLGSLELMVMYPAVASLYAWLYDKAKLRWTLPLFGLSAAYAALHFAIAPSPHTGPYALQWDARILGTLGQYGMLALGPERLLHFHWDWPRWLVPAATAIVAAGAASGLWLGGKAALFGAAVFLLLLAPVLPLPDHIMDYLPAGPSFGLSLVLAAGLSSRRKALPAAFCAFYLAAAIPASWHVMTWNYERSQLARRLVEEVTAYQHAHPDCTLLLTGMDTDQFLAGFADLPFELYGMMDVRLAPGAEKQIHDAAGIAPLYVLPPEKALPLLRSGRAAVLDVSRQPVRDVTPDYLAGLR